MTTRSSSPTIGLRSPRVSCERNASTRLLFLPVVFDGIVEQSGDSFVLCPAVLEHKRRDTHQMREVRDGGPFPSICTVHGVRRLQVAVLRCLVGDRRARAARAGTFTGGSGDGEPIQP